MRASSPRAALEGDQFDRSAAPVLAAEPSPLGVRSARHIDDIPTTPWYSTWKLTRPCPAVGLLLDLSRWPCGGPVAAAVRAHPRRHRGAVHYPLVALFIMLNPLHRLQIQTALIGRPSTTCDPGPDIVEGLRGVDKRRPRGAQAMGYTRARQLFQVDCRWPAVIIAGPASPPVTTIATGQRHRPDRLGRVGAAVPRGLNLNSRPPCRRDRALGDAWPSPPTSCWSGCSTG